jgi:hypothetical protein
MALAASHAKIIDVVENPTADQIDLTISPEKVFYIIVKAREFDAKVPPVEPDPASNPADTQQREILEDYAGDATFAELCDAINGLNDDEKADLVALVWIGRGDFDTSGWDQARAQAVQEQHHVAAYLTGNPLLGDLLEEGLAAFGYSMEEFEIDRL